jgi:hypothetical protein
MIKLIKFIIIFTIIMPLMASDIIVTVLFSTLAISKSTGDFIGAEIHIVPNPKGYSVIVQASEGSAGFPEVLDATVKDSTLFFNIPEKSKSGFSPGFYKGIVSKDGLHLYGPKGLYENYFLQRKCSFWQ